MFDTAIGKSHRYWPIQLFRGVCFRNTFHNRQLLGITFKQKRGKIQNQAGQHRTHQHRGADFLPWCFHSASLHTESYHSHDGQFHHIFIESRLTFPMANAKIRKKNIPDDEGVAGAFAQQVNSRGFCLACFHLRDSRYSPPSCVLLGIHVWGCRVFFTLTCWLRV